MRKLYVVSLMLLSLGFLASSCGESDAVKDKKEGQTEVETPQGKETAPKGLFWKEVKLDQEVESLLGLPLAVGIVAGDKIGDGVKTASGVALTAAAKDGTDATKLVIVKDNEPVWGIDAAIQNGTAADFQDKKSWKGKIPKVYKITDVKLVGAASNPDVEYLLFTASDLKPKLGLANASSTWAVRLKDNEVAQVRDNFIWYPGEGGTWSKVAFAVKAAAAPGAAPEANTDYLKGSSISEADAADLKVFGDDKNSYVVVKGEKLYHRTNN